MRLLSACLLVVSASVVLAPSSVELHERYGESNSEHLNQNGIPESERFTVRPGVSLTAWYGSDRRTCKCLISPTKPFDPNDPAVSWSAIPSRTIKEILEEILPVATRGKETWKGTIASSCMNEIVMLEFDNAVVWRSTIGCPSIKDQENNATIWFKRDICPQPPNPFGGPAPKARQFGFGWLVDWAEKPLVR
jgi:hypothetical protein